MDIYYNLQFLNQYPNQAVLPSPVHPNPSESWRSTSLRRHSPRWPPLHHPEPQGAAGPQGSLQSQGKPMAFDHWKSIWFQGINMDSSEISRYIKWKIVEGD